MIRSLKKGQTSIDVCYRYGTDTIGAKEIAIESMSDHAVFRIKLSPVDGNELDDANNIFIEHPETISKVIIDDRHICKKASEFLRAYSDSISFVSIESTYKKKYIFPARLKSLDDSSLMFEIDKQL